MAHQNDVNPAGEASLREYEPSPVVRSSHAEGTVTRLVHEADIQRNTVELKIAVGSGEQEPAE